MRKILPNLILYLLILIGIQVIKQIDADGDVNLASDKFMEIYQTAYDKAFPMVLHRTNSKKLLSNRG